MRRSERDPLAASDGRPLGRSPCAVSVAIDLPLSIPEMVPGRNLPQRFELPSSKTWTSEGESTGQRPSSTAASPPRKRGILRRKNEAWESYQVDDSCRRPWPSLWESPSTAPPRQWSSSRKSPQGHPTRSVPRKAHRRQSLRQRPARAGTPEHLRHRTDRSRQEKPEGQDSGWATALAVSSADGRLSDSLLGLETSEGF